MDTPMLANTTTSAITPARLTDTHYDHFWHTRNDYGYEYGYHAYTCVIHTLASMADTNDCCCEFSHIDY